MRIIFMGSPDFAVPTLEKIIKSEHEVVAVYAQPPRPAGRGKKLTATAVHKKAEEHAIDVFTPEKLTPEEIDKLDNLKPDLIVVAAYGLLLPKRLVETYNCLNLHPSSLPKYRGAAPLQRAIMAGETNQDICIMHMEAGLDTGPVYLRKNYDIKTGTTAGTWHDFCATQGAELMLDVINNWAQYKGTAETQVGDANYAHKISKDEKPVDFSKSAKEVAGHILGLSPFPGATLSYNGEVFKLFDAEITEKSAPSGQILSASKDGLTIACADKAITLKTLQRTGKKPMQIADILNGFVFEEGSTCDA